MRNRRWCPIAARSWPEAFLARALRFEGDRLWVSRRGRAESRADASRTVRARNVVSRRSGAVRFFRRRTPDPERGVLKGNGSGHGAGY